MPFDASKVPDGPAADLFYDGETGEGITDGAYDEQKRRLIEVDEPLPWAVTE